MLAFEVFDVVQRAQYPPLRGRTECTQKDTNSRQHGKEKNSHRAKHDLVMSSHGLPRNNDRETIRGASLRSCFLSLSRRQAQVAGTSPLFETTSAAGGSSRNYNEQATS